ncbi:MAG: leucine-rich repeat protein [Thiofilum sp.]|uniref:leucine-rich repeat protein n=1 Tax=Thiofilum sp. TaxID=2212733 RepID=UPI003BAEBCD1
MSKRALKLIGEAKEKRLTRLDLGKCALTKLPDKLFGLEWLEELVLANDWREWEIETQQWELKRSQNQWAANQIHAIPYQIQKLSKLTVLIASGNNIRDLSSLSELSQLQTLDLSSNQISDVSALSGLSQLQKLYLGANQISNVSALSGLSQLQTLDLSYNQISDLSALSSLSQLQTLYLGKNQISDVSALLGLSQLQTLYLGANQISDLSALLGLSQLQKLDLMGNQISDLSQIINLIEKGLPVSLKKNDWSDKKISLYNNPLGNPPVSIVEQGNEAILNYFKQLEDQGVEQLNEAKLIIVGEPAAGKTTLMETLLDEDFELSKDTESTLGVQVRTGWTFPHPNKPDTIFTTNIWDFGGQQIQYMTHQFFLTPSAAYVLVSANDRKEPTNFPYWFKIIHLLGEEQGRYSPVLVVLNEKDDKFINKFNFDRKFYEERYPELQIEVCEVNLDKRDDHFKAMRSTIQRMLSQLSHVTDPRPARWKDIRAALQECAKTTNHISFEKYSAICSEHAVEDEESQLVLSRYLHKLGSLLHFTDDPSLHNFIILNPQWAVDAVYSVLNNNEVARKDGYFSRAQVEAIWRDKYNHDERCKLLSLMQKENFEICYPLNYQKDLYIAPQLLNAEQMPFIWDNKDNLRFRFQYKFMPEGIITRLIVRLNTILACGIEGKQLIWRKGAVFTERDCRALVQEEENRDGLKIIDIAINGNVNERKYLLRRLRDEIQDIHHKWFRNIQAEQMIPCICTYCTDPQHKDAKFFEYQVLQRALNKGKATIECDKEFIDVSVKGLLEGVFEDEDLSPKREQVLGNIYNIQTGDDAQIIVGKKNRQTNKSHNKTRP